MGIEDKAELEAEIKKRFDLMEDLQKKRLRAHSAGMNQSLLDQLQVKINELSFELSDLNARLNYALTQKDAPDDDSFIIGEDED